MASPTDPDLTPELSPLMTVQELSRFLRISIRTVWRLVAKRHLPQPVRLGGATRWRRQDISDWLAAGCPMPEMIPSSDHAMIQEPSDSEHAPEESR